MYLPYTPVVAVAVLTYTLHFSIHLQVIQYLFHVLAKLYFFPVQAAAVNPEHAVASETQWEVMLKTKNVLN